MSIPPRLLLKIFQLVIKYSKGAFKEGTLIKKVEIKKIGNYLVKITRRAELGKDAGISQVVKIFKNGETEEVWHIVIKAGKIIHKHLLK